MTFTPHGTKYWTCPVCEEQFSALGMNVRPHTIRSEACCYYANRRVALRDGWKIVGINGNKFHGLHYHEFLKAGASVRFYRSSQDDSEYWLLPAWLVKMLQSPEIALMKQDMPIKEIIYALCSAQVP